MNQYKRKHKELVEKYHDKLDEVRAYGKAHSPEERDGQEFKTKMEQYREELKNLSIEKMKMLGLSRI